MIANVLVQGLSEALEPPRESRLDSKCLYMSASAVPVLSLAMRQPTNAKQAPTTALRLTLNHETDAQLA